MDASLALLDVFYSIYIYVYIYIFEIEKPYNLDIEVLYEVCGDVNWFFDCDSGSVWQYPATGSSWLSLGFSTYTHHITHIYHTHTPHHTQHTQHTRTHAHYTPHTIAPLPGDWADWCLGFEYELLLQLEDIYKEMELIGALESNMSGWCSWRIYIYI